MVLCEGVVIAMDDAMVFVFGVRICVWSVGVRNTNGILSSSLTGLVGCWSIFVFGAFNSVSVAS